MFLSGFLVLNLCVCMYVLFIDIYVCVYIYIYMYIYTQNNFKRLNSGIFCSSPIQVNSSFHYICLVLKIILLVENW